MKLKFLFNIMRALTSMEPRMKTPQACHHKKLVVGETCKVEQCSHGTVHLTLGDVTLRLRADGFLAVAAAIGVAANRVEVAAPVPPTRLLC